MRLRTTSQEYPLHWVGNCTRHDTRTGSRNGSGSGSGHDSSIGSGNDTRIGTRYDTRIGSRHGTGIGTSNNSRSGTGSDTRTRTGHDSRSGSRHDSGNDISIGSRYDTSYGSRSGSGCGSHPLTRPVFSGRSNPTPGVGWPHTATCKPTPSRPERSERVLISGHWELAPVACPAALTSGPAQPTIPRCPPNPLP